MLSKLRSVKTNCKYAFKNIPVNIVSVSKASCAFNPESFPSLCFIPYLSTTLPFGGRKTVRQVYLELASQTNGGGRGFTKQSDGPECPEARTDRIKLLQGHNDVT
jgi:hypothetical protein